MALSWTRWPVPLFRVGCVDIYNHMGTDDSPTKGESRWKFELKITFQGKEIIPTKELQTLSLTAGESTEILTVQIGEDGAVELSYTGHLVSADDTRELSWSSRLKPYDGNPSTMPYIGMWQGHDETRRETSTLQDRLKQEQKWTALKERFWGAIALIVFVAICIGLTVLAFKM